MKFIGGCLSVWLLALFHLGHAQNAYDPTDDMFGVFGSRCESYSGPLVHTALSQAGQFRGIIESIKDDKACQGISSALLPIEMMLADNLSKPTAAEIEVRRLRAQIQDVEILLASELAASGSDPNYIDRIKDLLYTKKLEMVSEQSRSSYEKETIRRNSIDTFRVYTNSLLAHLGQNLTCLNNHPNLIAQIGAQLLATSSSFVAGATGSALLATGAILDSFVSFLRNLKYSRHIRALNQSRLNAAIHCAIESLSATYCQARDVESVVDFNLQYRLRPKPNDLSWKGLELVASELPAFNSWANRLNSGSLVSSEAQANERKEAKSLELNFLGYQYDIEAEFSRNERKNGDSGGSDTDREILIDALTSILRGGIVSVTHTSTSMTEKPGPFFSSFVTDRSCGPVTFLYTAGKQRVCETNDKDSENCKACARKLVNGTVPKYGDLKGALTKLMAEATAFVASEVALVNETNHQLVLTESTRQKINRKSALDFIRGGIKYLQYLVDNPESHPGEPLLSSIRNALARLQQGEQILKNPTPDPKKDVTELTKIFVPSSDVFYVANEFREIVRQLLDKKINEGKLDENLAHVLQLSSGDSLSTVIENAFGVTGAKMQVNNAQQITLDTLTVMADLFSENVTEALEEVKPERFENIIKYENALSVHCVRSLLAPQSPVINGKDLRTICQNRVLYDAYPQSGIQVSYNDYSKPGIPIPKRICLLYDFFRKSRVYEMSLISSQKYKTNLLVPAPSGIQSSRTK